MVKLSIVIPYYETYELTVKILEKLIEQMNDEIEVFLIDDGCNEKRLDKFNKKINIIHSKENVGGAASINVGIKKAVGKYIAIIDSDDMISDNYIEVLLKTINEHDEDLIFFDWQDIYNGVIVHHPHNYAPWKAIYKKSIMPMFKEDVRYSYDVPFQEDLEKNEHTKYYIDEVLYFYNSHREGNLTSQKERIRKENMIKCQAIRDFTLERFNDLEDINRKRIDVNGKIFEGDTFKCEKDLADYLMGKNDKGVVVAKVLEIEPKKEEVVKPSNEQSVENVEKDVEEHVEKVEPKKNAKKSKKKTK